MEIEKSNPALSQNPANPDSNKVELTSWKKGMRELANLKMWEFRNWKLNSHCHSDFRRKLFIN